MQNKSSERYKFLIQFYYRGDCLTEESEKQELPFPTAPIVRLMRKNLDDNRIIRKRVKDEMNKWLGSMCEAVTKKMNEKPYSTVDYVMFKEAVQAYESLEEVEKEKQRILASLEKIKQDCDSLIRDLNRKVEL